MAARGSWLMFLRLLEAGFALAGNKLKLRVRLDYSSGSDLKGPATAANTRYSAGSALPLTGHGHCAVVRPYNYSSSLE